MVIGPESPSEEGDSRSSIAESARRPDEKTTSAFRRRKRSNWSPEAGVGPVKEELEANPEAPMGAATNWCACECRWGVCGRGVRACIPAT